MNKPYASADALPTVIPVFPLPGALLLPRGQMPLNIFEPRYLSMIDDAFKSHRVIGMVQPDAERILDKHGLYATGCAGRITSFSETGDGRYLVTLTGIARYTIIEEMTVMTPYRQCRVDFSGFMQDFDSAAGEGDVDREGLLRTLRNFADAHGLSVDWSGIDDAPNDALVNALSMMSPFGPREKQALLEASDLKTRADVLIAIAEIELARDAGETRSLQ
ncbi:LON peptidase substrate-binding domain-containing protein [Lichenihabitans psoromatis]|uniref:LON peptidase substrate-binding domain-containing protein n=1 Tax=Lichenihabitans psoromatis TaxID=2528642 RepID=UPI001035610D|nr:LON peptidase substrate-binding domain-containing protein [Lichenihabitans psoromatis]